jgi:hypothetical protein
MLNILTNHPNFWNKDIIQWLNHSLALTNGLEFDRQRGSIFFILGFHIFNPNMKDLYDD